MARKKQRLDRAEDILRNTPVNNDLLQEAFTHFCETGELPGGRKLAWAVCKQALNGGKPLPVYTDSASAFAAAIREVWEGAKRGETSGKPKTMSIREQVFREAVYADGPIQRGAREVLKLYIEFKGDDPTDPEFLADNTLPEHPGVGLFILGFPERLAQPPYVEQAERLFARANDLRRNSINHDDPAWEATLESAMQLLQDCGELPEPGLLRDCVLVMLEMQGLIWHSRGESVRELMALLDTAARTTGDEREGAIAKIRESALVGFSDPPIAAPDGFLVTPGPDECSAAP